MGGKENHKGWKGVSFSRSKLALLFSSYRYHSYFKMASVFIPSLSLETTEPDLLVSLGQLKELKSLVHTGLLDVRHWKDNRTTWSLLHVAAASNQVEIIQYLTSGIYPVNINGQDKQGNTALHIAVLRGSREAMKTLLELKVDDKILNEDQDPALHIALQQGLEALQLVKDFLSFPAVDIFVVGRHRQTTLHVLTKTDNVDMLTVIHDVACSRGEKADIVARDSNGVTIMHIAARAGAQRMMAFMFSASSEYSLHPKDLANMPTYDRRVPLHYAVENKRIECIEILLIHEADCTIHSGNLRPPVHLASSQDSLDILKLMVDMKGHAILQARDRLGGTLLHSSVSSINSKEIIPFLVENEVGVNKVDGNGLTPLANAIHLGSVAATESLLECGADPLIKDKEGRNAFHLAILGKRTKVCGIMMQCTAVKDMVQAADRCNMLPVHYALKLGLHAVVEFLLADSPIKDAEGNNYVHLAAVSGNTETLLMVLDQLYAQSMLNEANHEGLTPLHFAAMGSSLAIVQKLIDYGAIIHKCNKGLTPFMIACSRGNLDSADLLFSTNKFQKNWVDHEENTPLHWAVDGSNPHIITYCLDQGIPITLNNDGVSFFDKILHCAKRSLAQAAVLHKRWEECIDIVSGDLPHPLLRLIDAVPEVYGTVLDQCLTRSSHDPSQEEYWEEFNFKGVTKTSRDFAVTGASPTSSKNDNEEISSLGMHADIGLNEEELVKVRQDEAQKSVATRPRWQRVRNKGDINSLEVIHKLIKKKKELYLLHPVVEAFIQSKWLGFGNYYYSIRCLLHVLLAVFLTVFVSIIPLPPQFVQFQNQMGTPENGTCCDAVISIGATVVLYITFLLSILNVLVFFVEVFSHRFALIKHINEHAVVFISFPESVCSLIFLISILNDGLESALWNAAAIAVCLAWLSVGFNMQLIRSLNIGVYITIFMSTTRLILKVLMIMFFFILAFAIPLHVLVGSQKELQFTTPGLSIFAMLHTLIAVTDYLGFIQLEQDNQLRFSILIFLFLVVIIIMLPIVIVNILIGLAVGDIARIQQEAIISRRTVEVRALSHLDNLVYPEWLTRRICKVRHRHFPNQQSRLKRSLMFFTDKLTRSQPGDSWENKSVAAVVTKLITDESESIEKRLKKLEERMEEQLDGIRQLDAQLEGMRKSEAMIEGIGHLEAMMTKFMKAHGLEM